MRPLALPPHFDGEAVASVWRVPYAQRALDAVQWANTHDVRPAATDRLRICLLLVDMQNTFCIPGFELYVAGRSGRAAVDDCRRLCEFIYRNLNVITRITPTLDTHLAYQIFHPAFLVDAQGRHPEPYARISVTDVEAGHWRFNETLAQGLGITAEYGQRHLLHYVRTLRAGGKYALTVWPYHAMLGGIGHALVSAVEEAVFFHAQARRAVTDFHVKGRHPLTEHYSVLGPEVTTGPDGETLATRDEGLMTSLLGFDAVVVAGQAKSHCVAWTIEDLLAQIRAGDTSLARRVYLLEDCSSPVVVPGVADYSAEADAAFQRFSDAGMHVVRSTDALETWDGLDLRA
jgi:nicotinamidase-related amidase